MNIYCINCSLRRCSINNGLHRMELSYNRRRSKCFKGFTLAIACPVSKLTRLIGKISRLVMGLSGVVSLTSLRMLTSSCHFLMTGTSGHSFTLIRKMIRDSNCCVKAYLSLQEWFILQVIKIWLKSCELLQVK